jgi:hypothetical protein
MILALFKGILRRIRSGKILNKIASGEIVYFENPLENVALKYIPGGLGKLGNYFIKPYGQNESKIDFDSASILSAIIVGKQISKSKYNNYHLINWFFWNKNTITSTQDRTMDEVLVTYR